MTEEQLKKRLDQNTYLVAAAVYGAMAGWFLGRGSLGCIVFFVFAAMFVWLGWRKA